MSTPVAIIDMKQSGSQSMVEAVKLIGGLKDLNTARREAVIKLGVFHTEFPQYTSVSVTQQIVDVFDKSPKVYLTESDNYRGTGDERLEIWKDLFTQRVVPFNLTSDTDTTLINIENPIRKVVIELSKLVLKPRVFVSTHILRSFEKGSVLKNLFGLPPEKKKVQYHKNEIFYELLTTLYEAIGGIDLAVLDGTNYHHNMSGMFAPAGILIVGRDAVAVETVGYALLDKKIEKNKTIQAFVDKGLGIGNMDDIELLGEDFDFMRERTKDAVKSCVQEADKLPKRWSASVSLTQLIKSGFFKNKRRSKEEVAEKLIEIDSRAEEKKAMIFSTLRRRVKSGLLMGEKTHSGWVYWTE